MGTPHDNASTSRRRPRLRVIRNSPHSTTSHPGDLPPEDIDIEATYRRLVEDPDIIRFLRRYLRSLRFKGPDLDDLVHDVLLAARDALPTYDRDLGDVRPWLAGIADRQASNWKRKAYRYREEPVEELPEELLDPGPLPDQQVTTQRRAVVFHEVLSSIPARQYEVLVARELCGLDFSEIAEELGIPEATARSRYRAARRSVARAKDRWQAKQRRLGYDIVPIVLASMMSATAARAAGLAARGVITRIGLGLLGVLAVLAAALGLGSASPVRAEVPARSGVELVAEAVTARAAAVAVIEARAAAQDAGALDAGPSPTSSAVVGARAVNTPAPPARRASPEEEALIQRARAAVAAGNYAEARLLLEQHERAFPGGPFVGERAALLRLLGMTYR